jgi:hypothetical protein
MHEEEIVNRVAQYLKAMGWQIRSLHYPGAQGGLSLRRARRRRVVPDIVATKDGVGVLVVEVKSFFDGADAAKALAVARSAEFEEERTRLSQILQAEGPWFAAVAFAGPGPPNPPAGVAMLIVGPEGVDVQAAPLELSPHLSSLPS